jgi:hypothetical protein
MSKNALLLAALVLVPCLGGCFAGEAGGIISGDENMVAHDGRPIPGNGNYGDHVGGWGETTVNRFGHAAHSLHWMFLNTNSEDVPYETWWDDQLPRSMTTIGKTVDTHLFNYDWDDPFLGSKW